MFSGNRIRKALLSALLALFLPATLVLGRGIAVPADSLPGDFSALGDTLFESNRYTQPDDLTVVDNYTDIPGTFALVGESETIALYAESPNGAIRVVNKADGFVYGSSFAAAGVPIPYFNELWEGIIASACIVEYYTTTESGAIQTTTESFYTSPDTTLAFSAIENGFSLEVRFGLSGIGLTLRVFVDGEYLRVQIPRESVTENETHPLKSVQCYPFLGAVYGNSVPGYVFVPDGSGALIRYQEINALTDVYEFPYYGLDSGLVRDASVSAGFNFPVSGMILGIRQHGFVQIVADGDAFATLVVSPAKNNLKYYYACNRFVYRSTYLAPGTRAAAASGTGQQVIEENRNSCNVSLVYDFLAGDEADYVGMANAYQDYLRDQGALGDLSLPEGVVPALVELLGAETTEGFLFETVQAMTTYAQARAILSDLSGTIPAITAVYKGWSRGGWSGGGTKYLSCEPALGTKAELEALLRDFNVGNGSLSLYADFVTVSESGSYSAYRDVSQRVDSSLAAFAGVRKTWYFVNPLRTASLLENARESLSGWGAENLALGSLGYRLFSDFKDPGNPIDRAEAQAIYASALAASGEKWSLYRASAHLLAYASRDLAVPTTHSGYAVYTDTVPFAAILLAGTMEAYGPYANFFADRTAETLVLIDFGLLPSFILTEGSAYLLNDTELSSLCSSSYDTWKETVAALYGTVASALSQFYGERVVSRTVPRAGVTETLYANGVLVVVNHTSAAWSEGSLTVEARSFEVIPDA